MAMVGLSPVRRGAHQPRLGVGVRHLPGGLGGGHRAVGGGGWWARGPGVLAHAGPPRGSGPSRSSANIGSPEDWLKSTSSIRSRNAP